MKTCNVKKSEIAEVIKNLMIGARYENDAAGFSFTLRYDGIMFRYDMEKGTYKFFTDINAFASAIVRFQKRGY